MKRKKVNRNKSYKKHDVCMVIACLFTMLDAWAILEYYTGWRIPKSPFYIVTFSTIAIIMYVTAVVFLERAYKQSRKQ